MNIRLLDQKQNGSTNVDCTSVSRLWVVDLVVIAAIE